ncbi:hypothetical protein SAY86_024094 [Trapa natans]|uniref:Glycosyltransferase n=1 Tax=Trapa natans TaxID=22666 RepID=A0AAN7LWU2_TRANT|nr:hypothetical protein SAY86_024094 [Trapa natans]
MGSSQTHIAMYPWLAMGHLTAFLHLANKLAKRGYRVSVIIPKGKLPKLEPFNLHPDLITFVPITVPHVDGLPDGTETTSDVPFPLHSLVMTAMDRTEPIVGPLLNELKPHIIFYDFAYWLPRLARSIGVPAVHYCTVSTVTIGYTVCPARKERLEELTEVDFMDPPAGYPDMSIRLHLHEARPLTRTTLMEFGSHTRFFDRMFYSMDEADAIAFRSCREIEDPYIVFIQEQYRKPVLLCGAVIPEPPTTQLDETWASWLGQFGRGSVILCAFGSECTLKKEAFQELVLGLELTGLPFIAALKQPIGAESIDSALPEGFEERTRGRGVVEGGWIQQQLILEHPAIGCFVTHCGSNSLTEALVNQCQLVLLPHVGDQIFNARMMGSKLKVGVEVEKDEADGALRKEAVCRAIKAVMDEGSEQGIEVRENHARLREVLLDKGLDSSYTESFDNQLRNLIK